jgi:ABC-2 type transport system permease protein
MANLSSLVRMECFKYLAKPRTYISFFAITLIVVLIQIALWLDGQAFWDFLIQSLAQTFEIEGLDFNGNMVGFIVLQTLIVQMPLLVVLISGDIVSGEAQAGTLRALLSTPVSRGKMLFAKWLASEIYTFVLVLWLGILAWLVSLALFGPGDLVVMKSDGLTIIRDADSSWRFLGSFFIAFLSLSVINTFGFMLSCFAENSIAPIIVTMAVVIIFTIIGTFELPLFDLIKPFLFTTHTIVWRNMFDQPLDPELINTSILILILHIFLFYGISHWHFTRKDVLT